MSKLFYCFICSERCPENQHPKEQYPLWRQNLDGTLLGMYEECISEVTVYFCGPQCSVRYYNIYKDKLQCYRF